MNETIAVVAILAAVLVVGMIVFRKGRFTGKLKAPGGEVSVEGSNVEAASSISQAEGGGVVVEDAHSRRGGLEAHAHDGGGAAVRRVETEGDISVSSGTSGTSGSPSPSPKA